MVNILLSSRASENNTMIEIVNKCLSYTGNLNRIKSTIFNEIPLYSEVPKISQGMTVLDKLAIIFIAVTKGYLVLFSYVKNFVNMYFECKPTCIFFKDL